MYLDSMENAYSLKGKNCIVTGGAKGIGLGITTAFAHQGANVAIFARDEAAARKVIEEFGAKYEGSSPSIRRTWEARPAAAKRWRPT